MKEQKNFKVLLDKYYNHLNARFEKGYDYLKSKPEDKRAVETYNSIVDEMKQVEHLRNFYKE